MIKQFLIKNWLWVIVFGLMAFFYFDKVQESNAKDKVIDQVIDNHQKDKEEIDALIESLTHKIDSLNGQVDVLDEKSGEIELKLKKIQDEKSKADRDIPTYTDSKLDSILTNHRHK